MKRLFALLVALAGSLLAPPAARAEFIVGLTQIGPGALVTFDSATPGTVSAPVGITGLIGGAGEFAVGIDYRPADGAVVILTRQEAGANVGRGRVYTVNLSTGVATNINPLLTNAATGGEVLLTEPNRFNYGVDFNPVPNALRVVSTLDQNLRIVGGGAGLTNVDTPLAGPATPPLNPNISAIAYDRNNPGVGVTTLYALDTGPEPDVLRTIGGDQRRPVPEHRTGLRRRGPEPRRSPFR